MMLTLGITGMQFSGGRGRASTIYLHMAVIIGGGNVTKEETKMFRKD